MRKEMKRMEKETSFICERSSSSEDDKQEEKNEWRTVNGIHIQDFDGDKVLCHLRDKKKQENPTKGQKKTIIMERSQILVLKKSQRQSYLNHFGNSWKLVELRNLLQNEIMLKIDLWIQIPQQFHFRVIKSFILNEIVLKQIKMNLINFILYFFI